MNEKPHEEARKLIALAGSDLSIDQQRWLRSHLQDCSSCTDYAEHVNRTLSALRSRSVVAHFSLVQATQSRVRSRALELQQRRERTFLVCLSCLFVGISAAITTPFFWDAFEWIGEHAAVASWIWQAAFGLFWATPALAVSVVLMAHGARMADPGEK